MIKSVKRTDVKGFLSISDKRLSCYKNKHHGRRCVIIGNGPSLNKMDMSFLRDEITFGMNRIYLGFEKWDFMPTYYVSVNDLVIKQSYKDILKIPVPKFLAPGSLPYIPDGDDVIALRTAGMPFGSVRPFSTDPCNGLWEGFTVTYVAMQLAYYMGFSDVVLIGVDHHFDADGEANEEVVSEGDDQNHFAPDYFGKGFRWHLPDLVNSEVAYRVAGIAFEADGRRIIDATVDGKLAIFPKADYWQLFYENLTIDQIFSERKRTIDKITATAEKKALDGDVSGALSESLDVVESYPEALTAYNNIAALYSQIGELNNSVEYISKALRINSESRETVINYVRLLILAGEPEMAITFCTRYLRRDGYDQDILSLMNEIKKNRTDEQSVHRECSALQIEDYLEEALLLISIGNMLANGRHDEAIGFCLGLLEYPGVPFACNMLGLIAWQDGDDKRALKYFSKALKNNPDRDTILNCGRFLESIGKPDDAVSLYSSYLKQCPDDEEISGLIKEARDIESINE